MGVILVRLCKHRAKSYKYRSASKLYRNNNTNNTVLYSYRTGLSGQQAASINFRTNTAFTQTKINRAYIHILLMYYPYSYSEPCIMNWMAPYSPEKSFRILKPVQKQKAAVLYSRMAMEKRSLTAFPMAVVKRFLTVMEKRTP